MALYRTGGVALCFPGQLNKLPEGIMGEWSGGGKNFSHSFFEVAWDRTGFDLSSFFFQDEEEDCYLNLKMQVVSFLLSLVSFDRYRRTGGRWDFITEHSMGIYAALVAADSLTFEEGLAITKGIGLMLEKAGEKTPGGLAAVIGMEGDEIKKICSDVKGALFVANVNGSRHFVVSGEEVAVAQGVELCLKGGAISVQRLTFNAPLHSPLMASIQEDVREFIKDFDIRPPQTSIVSHWSGKELRDPNEIKAFLIEELYRPVDWAGCVQYLISRGTTCFIEMGPHDTLTKLIRWIDRDVKALSYGERDAS